MIQGSQPGLFASRLRNPLTANRSFQSAARTHGRSFLSPAMHASPALTRPGRGIDRCRLRCRQCRAQAQAGNRTAASREPDAGPSAEIAGIGVARGHQCCVDAHNHPMRDTQGTRTNLGVRSSNLFGRARKLGHFLHFNLPRKCGRGRPGADWRQATGPGPWERCGRF